MSNINGDRTGEMERSVEGVRNRGTEKGGKLSTLQMREEAVVLEARQHC
jgi:hypothetical protein